jgi:hypothetical protein
MDDYVFVERQGPSRLRFRKEWSYLSIVRYLTFGFNERHLSHFFDSIPAYVALEFRKLLEKVQGILDERRKHLIRYTTSCTSADEVSEVFDMEAELWKEQTICGFLKLTYDPSTQEPLGVQLNEKLSEYLGTDRQTFSNCFMECNLPLPCADIDFLFLLIDETKHSTKCRIDRFDSPPKTQHHIVSFLPQVFAPVLEDRGLPGRAGVHVNNQNLQRHRAGPPGTSLSPYPNTACILPTPPQQPNHSSIFQP